MALIPAPLKPGQRQRDNNEFKVSMVYIAGSRPAKAKKKKKKKKKESVTKKSIIS